MTKAPREGFSGLPWRPPSLGPTEDLLDLAAALLAEQMRPRTHIHAEQAASFHPAGDAARRRDRAAVAVAGATRRSLRFDLKRFNEADASIGVASTEQCRSDAQREPLPATRRQRKPVGTRDRSNRPGFCENVDRSNVASCGLHPGTSRRADHITAARKNCRSHRIEGSAIRTCARSSLSGGIDGRRLPHIPFRRPAASDFSTAPHSGWTRGRLDRSFGVFCSQNPISFHTSPLVWCGEKHLRSNPVCYSSPNECEFGPPKPAT